jgi:AcrR family transcriptional regulator
MSRDTPDRILDAAEESFALHGFAGARTAVIAAAAGVNKAALHYWFRDKEGLYRATFVRTFDRVVAMADTVLTAEEDPVELRVERFIRGYAELVLQRPRFVHMVVREILDGGNALRDVAFPRMMSVGVRYITLVARGQAQETLSRGFDPRFVPLLTLSPFIVFTAVVPLFGELLRAAGGEIPGDFVESVVSVLTRGMFRRPDDPGRERLSARDSASIAEALNAFAMASQTKVKPENP